MKDEAGNEGVVGPQPIVHPEVQAHIGNLVSALGGRSVDEDGRYVLGDDALDVLRDLKKWIRFYDEKTNRMDVARCLFDANIITGDLLPILALWTEAQADHTSHNTFLARIALACLEIMVPLTWPLERDPETTTMNHYRHMPVLQLAQVAYKSAIMNYDGARILHTIVRIALPAMATPIGDRTPREQGVIKLVLFFLRNIAQIAPPPNLPHDFDETQISRSTLIDAFAYQDILFFLLTLASNMGDEFRSEDVLVMEILFHLVKRVDPEKLFMAEDERHKAKADELSQLMQKENAMLKSVNRRGPTRHNRFGTMIWVKRDGGKMMALSGQDVLADANTRNEKMDSTKTYRAPQLGRRKLLQNKDLGPAPKLNARATGQLRSFVEEFLDAGFNPLFQSVRKSIDREAPHLLYYHPKQFFYLVAWFLEAERTRRKQQQQKRHAHDQNSSKEKAVDVVDSFHLVANVLTQEMFVTMNRTLRNKYESKSWEDLIAVMRCFTQILLTVQDMYESGAGGSEENEEIADNILSRLFYEDTTQDLLLGVLRNYKNQGFEFLDAVTELHYHFTRILEAYSKQNVDMHIRSRKRTRRKKRKANDGGGDETAGAYEDDDGGFSADDEEMAQKAVSERKFDFQKFSASFANQAVVDTFVTFTRYYQDLDDDQLKRSHRFFYRLAFKQEQSVLLFRVDILQLFHTMFRGSQPLDKSSKMYRDWAELSKQVLRKCIRKLQERPSLFVELLFSKSPNIAYVLETGEEKPGAAKKGAPKPVTELEFRRLEDPEQQIALVVSLLIDKNHMDHIYWLKNSLAAALEQRQLFAPATGQRPFGGASVASLFQDEDTTNRDATSTENPSLDGPQHTVFVLKPDTEERRKAILRNAHFRLLLKLVGVCRMAPREEETMESVWIIPTEISADQIEYSIQYIQQAEFNPMALDKDAMNELRRKTQPRSSAARARAKARRENEDDADDDDDDIEALFPADVPRRRKAIDLEDGGKAKKSKSQRRKKHGDGEDEMEDEEVDEEELAERARKRKQREREKARKIKSEMYVHASDDDSDAGAADIDFWAREAEQHQRNQENARKQLEPSSSSFPANASSSKRKTLPDDDDDDDMSMGMDVDMDMDMTLDVDSDQEKDDDDGDEPLTKVKPAAEPGKRRPMLYVESSSDEEEPTQPDTAEKGADKGPPPSDANTSGQRNDGNGDGDGDDDDVDMDVPTASSRRRVKGFLIDSDDE